MKIFSFFISNFHGIFQFFISLWWYGQILSNFKFDFFQFFPFPSNGIANFFQFKFQKQFFSNFPYGINEFFPQPEVAKFI
jgi:hypothetical protein